jgi:tRNA(Ile)-lysidine synthase TilS/MesJ
MVLEKVRQTIKTHCLLAKGERILVGCSGGLDSVVLLHALHGLIEYELELHPVYVNWNFYGRLAADGGSHSGMSRWICRNGCGKSRIHCS